MGRQRDFSRALRIAGVAFSLILVMLAALPVAASRYTISHHLSVVACVVADQAIWTGVPANARTYQILLLTDGGIPILEAYGHVNSRSGSDGFSGKIFGSALISTQIVFYDSQNRAVYSADNSEGPIAISC